jgi:hypothetical protein
MRPLISSHISTVQALIEAARWGGSIPSSMLKSAINRSHEVIEGLCGPTSACSGRLRRRSRALDLSECAWHPTAGGHSLRRGTRPPKGPLRCKAVFRANPPGTVCSVPTPGRDSPSPTFGARLSCSALFPTRHPMLTAAVGWERSSQRTGLPRSSSVSCSGWRLSATEERWPPELVF